MDKNNKFTKAKNNFKKGLLIATATLGLGTSTALFTGCPNPNVPGDPGKENPAPGDEKYGTPCDKVLGNGNFVIHNFIGEDDYLKPATIAEDVNYYLGKGETYVKGLIDRFSESMQNDPTAQNYFSEFISQQKNNKFERLDEGVINAYGIDKTINKISEPCFPIFEDYICNIDNNRDRCIFITGCKTIFAEGYNYGLGAYRNKETPLDEKYNATRQEIRKSWNGKTINQPFDIDQDIDQDNCMRITQELSRIASDIAPKMGIKANHIYQTITIAGVTYSLQAMDDRAADDLGHNVCNSKTLIIDKMSNIADRMFEQEQQKNMGMER